MRGMVSFHPVDVEFFDDIVAPLLAGRKINPDPYLASAVKARTTWTAARAWPRALATLAAEVEPPAADPSAKMWDKIKTNLARFDHRPAELVRRAAAAFDPDLHWEGRPFFVSDSALDRIAEIVEAYRESPSEGEAGLLAHQQMAKLDPELGKGVRPEEGPSIASDLQYRQDLLEQLKQLHDIARAARDGAAWRSHDGDSRPGVEVLCRELPWRAVYLHSRVVPFWSARDVDGLETICRAADVPAPDALVPAWRLFADSCEQNPALKDNLRLELGSPHDVGAFVAPSAVPALLEFLSDRGARIIAAAARAGEGPAAAALLRKIKECATYAAKKGFGYLEASGIEPPGSEE